MTLTIDDLFDVQDLEDAIEAGYVRRKISPDRRLALLNYAEKAQFEQAWTPVTTQCRGLIYDVLTHRVVAKPLPKFFNLAELDEEHQRELRGVPFTVHEKMDGSLFIAVKDREHGLVTATRGSFTSEQSIRGREMLFDFDLEKKLKSNTTYLFEVIYPENRIVVDYGGEEKLVLLTVIDSTTGEEWSVEEVADEAGRINCWLAEEYAYDEPVPFNVLKNEIADDEEGFVLRFSTGYRVKIKGDEYVRLHRILTGTNSKHVWEWLRDGKRLDDMIEDVPDEFHRWVQDTATGLLGEFAYVMGRAKLAVAQVHAAGVETRKEAAEIIKKSEYPGIAFALLDNNQEKAEQGAWRIVKPKATFPFVKDEIE